MSKPVVILSIFRQRFDVATKSLSDPIVTLDDVQKAITAFNALNQGAKPVSARNPANLFKDFTRRRASANRDWPPEIFNAGFTAKQILGDNRCFEFIPISPGQTEAFPEEISGPTPATPIYRLTSAVIPLASRKLGRNDEPWLTQVAVRLRVVETYLSLFSSCGSELLVVDHLQNNVKLRRSEIDAVFFATEKNGKKERDFVVTCEVKRRTEDVTMDQVERQPRAILEAMTDVDIAVPMVLRSLGKSQIHVIEFERVHRSQLAGKILLTKVGDVVFKLEPTIPGLG